MSKSAILRALVTFLIVNKKLKFDMFSTNASTDINILNSSRKFKTPKNELQMAY